MVSKRRATYDDIRALPEHLVGELVDGDLYVSPRPAGPHTVAASVISADLGAPFGRGRGGPGGWWILVEPELHLAPDIIVVPDVAGWLRTRMPTVPQGSAFVTSPDWVCEVVSPSTARIDRGRKTSVYAGAGVAWMWLVDPLARTLEVYRLDGERHWTLLASHTDDASARIPPFDAIELDLAGWWVPGPPPP